MQDEFALYYLDWEMRIRSLARRLSLGEHDLAQDLEHVGRCALWRLDRARVSGDERSYIWRMLRNSMVDELRRESRARIIVPKWRRDRRLARCRVESGLHTLERRELHRRGVPRHYGAAPYNTEDRAAA
jgi:hypothetical protein